MPKTDIDYSNTIIYKITCKDPTVKHVYVGHTTNFVQRKHAHKQGCVNEKSSNYKCKLYETIRTNGGWYNWNMEIINFFNCRDHYEARIKEQEYFVLLNATLNSIEPLPKPKEVIPKNIVVESNKPDKPKKVNKIFCKQCNIECIKSEWENHIVSDVHKTNHAKTLSGKYTCESCNFICSKQSNYNTHLQTRKHQIIQNDAKKVSNGKYSCSCGSTYKYASGYCRHKKTCTYVPSAAAPSVSQSTLDIQETDAQKAEPNWIEMIQMLMKENQEIRNFMVTQHNTIVEQNKKLNDHNLAVVEQNKTLTEVVKTLKPANNSYNTTNNNQKYTINMFLNEKCKDAQNFSKFIEELKPKVDMMKIYENGYVDGISKLFIDGLSSMEITERPLHCTDERRNVFYVHDNDEWNKDEDLKDTKKAIFHISQENLKQCVAWSNNIPPNTDRHDHITQSVKLCKVAWSGDDKNTEKIIKNISKEIPLNKQVMGDV